MTGLTGLGVPLSNLAPGIGRFRERSAVSLLLLRGWWEGRFEAGEYIGYRRLLAFPFSRPSLISGGLQHAMLKMVVNYIIRNSMPPI